MAPGSSGPVSPDPHETAARAGGWALSCLVAGNICSCHSFIRTHQMLFLYRKYPLTCRRGSKLTMVPDGYAACKTRNGGGGVSGGGSASEAAPVRTFASGPSPFRRLLPPRDRLFGASSCWLSVLLARPRTAVSSEAKRTTVVAGLLRGKRGESYALHTILRMARNSSAYKSCPSKY